MKGSGRSSNSDEINQIIEKSADIEAFFPQFIDFYKELHDSGLLLYPEIYKINVIEEHIAQSYSNIAPSFDKDKAQLIKYSIQSNPKQSDSANMNENEKFNEASIRIEKKNTQVQKNSMQRFADYHPPDSGHTRDGSSTETKLDSNLIQTKSEEQKRQAKEASTSNFNMKENTKKTPTIERPKKTEPIISFKKPNEQPKSNKESVVKETNREMELKQTIETTKTKNTNDINKYKPYKPTQANEPKPKAEPNIVNTLTSIIESREDIEVGQAKQATKPSKSNEENKPPSAFESKPKTTTNQVNDSNQVRESKLKSVSSQTNEPNPKSDPNQKKESKPKSDSNQVKETKPKSDSNQAKETKPKAESNQVKETKPKSEPNQVNESKSKAESNQSEPHKHKAKMTESKSKSARDSYIITKDITFPITLKSEDAPRYSAASLINNGRHEVRILDRAKSMLYTMVVEKNTPSFSAEATNYLAVATYQGDFVYSRPDGVYRGEERVFAVNNPIAIRADPIDSNRLWVLGVDSNLTVVNAGQFKHFTHNIIAFDITPKKVFVVYKNGTKIWERSDVLFEPIRDEKYNEEDGIPMFLDDNKIFMYSAKKQAAFIKYIDNDKSNQIPNVVSLLKIDETTITTDKFARCGNRFYNLSADVAVIDCGWVFYIKDGVPHAQNKSLGIINEAEKKSKLVIEDIKKQKNEYLESISQYYDVEKEKLNKITITADGVNDIIPHLVALGSTIESLKELCSMGKEDMAFSIVSEKELSEFLELSDKDVLKNAIDADKLSESTIIQLMNHLNRGIRNNPKVFVPITKEALLCLSEESFPAAKCSAGEMLTTVLKIHRDSIGSPPYETDLRYLAHILASIDNSDKN